jgi:hypothetical protein
MIDRPLTRDRTANRPAGYSTAARRAEPTKALLSASDVTQLIEPVEKLILQYPAVALASAFLVGVALACWIKRK